jgi:hypothetical protein
MPCQHPQGSAAALMLHLLVLTPADNHHCCLRAQTGDRVQLGIVAAQLTADINSSCL